MAGPEGSHPVPISPESFVASLPPALGQLMHTAVEPAIVELFSPAHGVIHPIGDMHPLSWLHRRNLADDVIGIAVIARGSVVVGANTGPGPLSAGASVWVVHLLWRSGEVLSGVRIDDGRSTRSDTRSSESSWADLTVQSPAEGLIPDAMHRALGLSTPVGDADPAGYWLVSWLYSMVAHDAVSLPDALRWHPGLDPRDVPDDASESDYIELAAEALRNWADEVGWSGLWSMAVSGWIEPGVCDAELAAWFDEGSFIRHISAVLPPPDVIALTVAEVLPPDTARMVIELAGRITPWSWQP